MMVLMVTRFGWSITVMFHGFTVLDNDVTRFMRFVGLVTDIIESQGKWVEGLLLLRFLFAAVFFGWWWWFLFLEHIWLQFENISIGDVKVLFLDAVGLLARLNINGRLLKWSVLKLSFRNTILSTGCQSICQGDAYNISRMSWLWSLPKIKKLNRAS